MERIIKELSEFKQRLADAHYAGPEKKNLQPYSEIEDDVISLIGKITKLMAMTELGKMQKTDRDLFVGEYNLPKGIIDLSEGSNLHLQIANKTFVTKITGSTKAEQTKAFKAKLGEFLFFYFQVKPNDIIINEAIIDTNEDALQFVFAFSSVKNTFTLESEDIAFFTPAKRVYGTIYKNKAFLRSSLLKHFPPEILQYPLTGFAAPYNMDNPEQTISLFYSSAAPNGMIADLRAFSSGFDSQVAELVKILMEKKWLNIFTQKKKYRLIGDKYI